VDSLKIIFLKGENTMKKFFERIGDAIKRWLLDCFDAVDGSEYRRIERLAKMWYRRTTHLEERINVVEMQIPITIAPWYADKEFSKELWDIINDCDDYVYTREDDEFKYAKVMLVKIN
jgi:hypothetical protein